MSGCPVPGPRIYLRGPAMAEHFFNAADSDLSHARGWDLIFGDRFGRGLLNLDGEPHRAARRALMAVLSRKATAEYASVAGEILDRAVPALPVDEAVDLHAFTKRVTFEVAAAVFAGLSASEAAELLDLFTTLQAPDLELGTPGGARLIRDFARSRRRVRALLLTALDRATAVDDERSYGVAGLVARLRALPAPPTDEEIAGHIAILLLAGFETTAYLSARLLWLLARHPAEQSAVREDLAASDPGDSRLLEAAFAETARLHPPLFWLPRRAETDLVFGDTLLPAGTEVFYSIADTQRDPAAFADPDEFRPRRFASTDTRRGRFAMTPFSAGRRLCAGIHVGTMETKLITAAVLHRFHLHAPPGPHIGDASPNGTSVTPSEPLLVRLQEVR
ncbi:cytochrome P450 [Nonomuraea sp. MG754425]|nr:cytochrome P450 [Nonomuraea sp. MG754425]